MKWTIAGLVLVGLIAAVSAAVLAVTLKTDFISGAGADLTRQEIEIMVATRDLPANAMVDSTAVASEKVLAKDAPPNAITNTAQVVGRVLVVPVLARQAFTSNHFASSDSGLSLAAIIPAGNRAMSVMLSDETGIEDLLYPGSVVDVVTSFRFPAIGGTTSAESVSVTLLQGIKVLAIGKHSITSEEKDATPTDPSGRRGRMVTLMVNTAQAEALQLASANGKITLSLRNPLDQQVLLAPGTRISDLSKDLAKRIRDLQNTEVGLLPLMAPPVSSVSSSSTTSGGESTSTTTNGASSVTSMPGGGDGQAAGPRQGIWITTIYRGRIKETQQFTVPVEDQSH